MRINLNALLTATAAVLTFVALFFTWVLGIREPAWVWGVIVGLWTTDLIVIPCLARRAAAADERMERAGWKLVRALGGATPVPPPDTTLKGPPLEFRFDKPVHVAGSAWADAFRGKPDGCCQGRAWNPPDNHRVYPYIEVLPVLKGKPWNDVALAYVSALRPIWIRVIGFHDGTQLDARPWRVTVQLEADGTIDHVHMETVAWAPPGVHGAGGLTDLLEGREPSPYNPIGVTVANLKGVQKVQFTP